MTNIDTATGLPTLPEEFFWKVTQSGEFLFVKLVKKGWINFTVKKSPIFKRDATQSLILWVARGIYRETFDKAHLKYVGEYPPKSL